jgi:hypothetical protein
MQNKNSELDIEFENLKHWAKIAENLGLSVQFYKTDAPLNRPVLHLILPKDDKERDRGINILYIPSEKGKELNAIRLIQFFSGVPFIIDEKNQEQVKNSIYQINNQLPLGHFSIGQTGTLYYRYVTTTPKNELMDSDYLQQLILLIIHQLDRTFPMLESIANGQ